MGWLIWLMKRQLGMSRDPRWVRALYAALAVEQHRLRQSGETTSLELERLNSLFRARVTREVEHRKNNSILARYWSFFIYGSEWGYIQGEPPLSDWWVTWAKARVGAKKSKVPLTTSLTENEERPTSLAAFTGQNKVLAVLQRDLRACKALDVPYAHSLLLGPGGVGKTTLGLVLAKELGVPCKIVNAVEIPTMEVLSQQIASAMLLRSENGAGVFGRGVLIIDEAHYLPKKIQTSMYHILEDHDFVLRPIGAAPRRYFGRLATDPSLRNGQMFTMICITTDASRLLGPLRDRFHNQYTLEPYDDQYIAKQIKREASKKHIFIYEEVAMELAKRSFGIPRVALKHRLEPVMRMVEGYNLSRIVTKELIDQVMEAEGIDPYGCDRQHRQLMRAIQNGIGSLEGLVMELNLQDSDVISYVVEPQLRRQHFIRVQPGKGRVLTPEGEQYLQSVASWD